MAFQARITPVSDGRTILKIMLKKPCRPVDKKKLRVYIDIIRLVAR
jgi:hypothetical protein